MASAYKSPEGEVEPPAPPFDSAVLCDEDGCARWMPELVLGVSSGATEGEVVQARRVLQRRFHPDRPGGSVDASQVVNAAADILLRHRSAYEEWVRSGTISLQPAFSTVRRPSGLINLEAELTRQLLGQLIQRGLRAEARARRRQLAAAAELQLWQRATSRAQEARRAEDAAASARDEARAVAEAVRPEADAAIGRRPRRSRRRRSRRSPYRRRGGPRRGHRCHQRSPSRGRHRPCRGQ